MQKILSNGLTFDVTSEAMTQAFRYDVATCQQDIHLNRIELLVSRRQVRRRFFALLLLRHGQIGRTVKKRHFYGRTHKKIKYYSYYLEAYNAVWAAWSDIMKPDTATSACLFSDTQINEGDPEPRKRG